MSADKQSQNEPSRDVRIDRIGFINELTKGFAGPLALKIKSGKQDGDRMIGDYFQAVCTQGEQDTIDPEKFVDAYDAGKMTRAQLISALKIAVPRAREILSEKDLTRMATTAKTALSLRVTRIKGVQIQLVDAVKDISTHCLPEPAPVA